MFETAHSTSPSAASTAPVYARFSRRIQGMMIDNMILLVGFIIALFLAASTGLDGASRAIGFAAVATIFLYEPILVSVKGGTIGHALRNLRVVDDRTGGNIGIVAAFVRYVVKMFLGWASFISMTTTRRHQALHDVLTHSTVQVKDLQKAESHHYVGERPEIAVEGMPSKARRFFAICVYSLLSFPLVSTLGYILFLRAGILTQACLRADRCSPSEHLAQAGLGLLMIALIGLVTYLGWNGRLFGCRAKA